MKCNLCSGENDVILIPIENEFAACNTCRVTEAKDRCGELFNVEEMVYIKNYHPKTDNRVFIIKGIFVFSACESGHMVFLIDKETGRPLKSLLDTNWLMKK